MNAFYFESDFVTVKKLFFLCDNTSGEFDELQRCESPHSQLFVECFFGNSVCWWADIVLTYCPSKPMELMKENATDITNEGMLKSVHY